MNNNTAFIFFAFLIGSMSFYSSGYTAQEERSCMASPQNVEEKIRDMMEHDLSYYARVINFNNSTNLWLSGAPILFTSFVFSSHYSDEKTTTEIISLVKQQAKTLNVPIIWWVTPNTLPHTMRDLLMAQEFSFVSTWYGMLCFLDEIPHYNLYDTNVAIKRITDPHQITSWIQILGPSFGLDDTLTIKYSNAIKEKDFNTSSYEHFGAFLNNEIVATGSILLNGDNVWVANISTHPSFRKRGIATQLVHALLHRARELGVKYAVLLSTPDGASIYQKVGFKKIFDIEMYCINNPVL